MWGQVDTAHDNATEMTVGLPADTLAAYGIKNLPDNYMLDIKVSGTTTNPQVDVPRQVPRTVMNTAGCWTPPACPALWSRPCCSRTAGLQFTHLGHTHTPGTHGIPRKLRCMDTQS